MSWRRIRVIRLRRRDRVGGEGSRGQGAEVVEPAGLIQDEGSEDGPASDHAECAGDRVATSSRFVR